MPNKINSKAGVVLMFAVIGLIIAIPVYFIYENSSQVIKDFIGHNQFELLSTAKETEKAQFYLERSADIAAKKALFELASADIGCGEDLGYSKWISEGKTCYQGVPAIKDRYLKLFKEKLDEVLSTSEISVLSSTFDLSMYERKSVLDVNAEMPSKSFDLIWPANGHISSCYGYRKLEIKDTELDWHDGVDISVPEGTDVKSPGDGTVVKMCKEWVDACACSIASPSCPVNCDGKCGNYGNYIIIKHNDNLYTRMSHLKDILVSEGAVVKKGEVIAKSGNTGLSEGPHIDFKVYFSSNFASDVGKGLYDRNPLCYLPAKPAEDFTAGSCNDYDGNSIQLCPGTTSASVKSGTYIKGTAKEPLVAGTGKIFSGVRVTHYYAPSEKDFSMWSTGAKKEDYPNYEKYGWCVIPLDKRGFYEEVKCEGSGVSVIGTVYNYKSIKPEKELSKPVDKIGTATGTKATAHRTIAVAPGMIPYGSKVKITFENCKDQSCCNKWNGEYVAEDTGIAMKNDWNSGIAHIDLYVGEGKQALEDAKCLPEKATLEIISSKTIPSTSGQIIYKLKSNFNAFIPYSFEEFDLVNNQLKSIREEVSAKCENAAKRDECIYQAISTIDTQGIIWSIDCDKKIFGPARADEVRLCAKSRYSFLAQNGEKEPLIYKVSFITKINESIAVAEQIVAETQQEIAETQTQTAQIPAPVSISAKKIDGFSDMFEISIVNSDASVTGYSFYLKQSNFCSSSITFNELNKINPGSLDLSSEVDKATVSIPIINEKYCLLVVAENVNSASESLSSSRYNEKSFALLSLS